jgi:hypothetical protein
MRFRCFESSKERKIVLKIVLKSEKESFPGVEPRMRLWFLPVAPFGQIGQGRD